MSILRLEGFGEVPIRAGMSILEAAAKARLPVGSACGGECACSTCHVYVKEGAELLSDQEDREADALDKAFDVRPTSRLGCQARVVAEGTITVEISRESLETYENEHPKERGKYTSRASGHSATRACLPSSGDSDSAEPR
jgi:2Fe-2S ferredoxin